MRAHRFVLLLLFASLLVAMLQAGCARNSGAFVIALSDDIKTIDPIGSPAVDAASERIRTLMFNSLIKKDEKFDYVGELASNIQRSDDGLTYTFTLHDGIRFHDGRSLTSADVKYTIDTVLANSFAKSASFFEGSGKDKKSYVQSVTAVDPKTIVIRLNKPWVGLFSNLLPIAIIPKDSYAGQKDHPVGSGPFKFVHYDSAQQVVDLEANNDYWEGAPQIGQLRVRVLKDTNALQAELLAGRVDIAPLPTSLSPDAIKFLGQNPRLKVLQFPGSNIVLLTFNVKDAPLNDVRVRQAICYAIDRESLVRNLLLGQGTIAHSILPKESWAYTQGQTYSYDPAAAKALLDEAGYKNPDARFANPLTYKVSGSSIAARQYAGVIHDYLRQVGIPVSIEPVEFVTLLDLLKTGQFQIYYGPWVGGNQDPIFYKDLFASSEIPSDNRASRNRSRYKNPELDALLDEAVNTWDREKARLLYGKIQAIVSRDAPVFPLWYQANMVIAKKNVENIQINASGDWSFVRNLTVR